MANNSQNNQGYDSGEGTPRYPQNTQSCPRGYAGKSAPWQGQPGNVQQGMPFHQGGGRGFGNPGNGGPQDGRQQFCSPPRPSHDRARFDNAGQRGGYGSPRSRQDHRSQSPRHKNRSSYGEGGRGNNMDYSHSGHQSPQSDSSFDSHSSRDGKRHMFTPSPNKRGNSGRWPDSSQSSGGYGHRDANQEVHLSKKLSFLLRHGAERQGFTLMPGGFLYVDDILRLHDLKEFRLDDVKRVVANNDKQRFALKENPDTKRMMIRANQGHTIEVDDLDLKPITSADEAEQVIHGTYYQSWLVIKESGLSRMGRNHIHFAAGEPGESGVISGMRSSCEVIIGLDMKKALADGLQFFRSANNVILCAGDKDGIIYPAYFEFVIQRSPRMMLQYDKNITKANAKESPPKSKKKDKKAKKREREDDNEEGKKKSGRQEKKKERKENESDNIDVDIQGIFLEGEDSKEDTTEVACVEKEKKPDTPPVDKKPNQPEAAVPPCDDGQTESVSDVEVEEDYRFTKITDDKLCISAVETICGTKSAVAVCCYGDKLGEKDGSISHILCVDRKDCFQFVVGENPSLMTHGKLINVFTSKDFPKVFHGCGKMSKSLFDQFEVLLDGTNLYDTKVVFEMMKDGGEGNMKDFEDVNFCPDTWPKDLPSTIDQDSETEERDRCVIILKAYEIMIRVDGMDKKYKKDIFEEVNGKIGLDAIKEYKKAKAKLAKSQCEPPPLKGKQSGGGKKKKGKK